MTGRSGARHVATLVLIAGLLAACQAQTVVIQRPPIPDQPNNADRVGDALIVGQGTDPALGEYRAWIYRTRDGMSCFEVATVELSTIGCSPGAAGALGIGAYETDGGWFVAGATDQPAETAVVQLADGTQVTRSFTTAPPGIAEEAKFVVIPVSGAAPQTVTLLAADGSVLDTIELTP